MRFRSHPKVHVVAGCVVVATEANGIEEVERAVERRPEFWGHYHLAADGRQVWLADFDEREEAIESALAAAGGSPVFVEDEGVLTRVRATLTGPSWLGIMPGHEGSDAD
jgi:hypothetical protein